MSEPLFPMTNGYTLKRLKTFAEISKWLLSGTIAILFFTYDKLDFTWIKLLSFLLSLFPIIALTGAYAGFKKYADYLEDQVEINNDTFKTDQGETGKLVFSARMPTEDVWPKSFHANYKFGTIAFVSYATLVLIAVALVKKEQAKKEEPSAVYHQVFNYRDTTQKPASPFTVGQIVPIPKIYFSTALWNLRPGSYPSLNQVIDTLKKFPQLKINIRAHTDDVGTTVYNQWLSEHRADTVVKYIVSKGIQPERLRATGYGETSPIRFDKTKEGRQLNRRVEFEVLNN